MTMTISEGLSYAKQLREKYHDLKSLRDENSSVHRRIFGGGDKDSVTIKEPVYKLKVLDAKMNLVSKEMRLLEQAIKRANATFTISYEPDESVWNEPIE